MTVILMNMLNEILLPVFSEWLEILDVGNFDSALCNRTQRSSFLLDLISNSIFIHNGSSLIDDKFLFSWISLRKMKVKNLHLRHCGKLTPSILSVLKTSKNFDRLVFNSNLAVVLSEQNIEIQTKSLELVVFEDDDEKYSVELSDLDFENLITKIKGIQTLEISACLSLTDQAFYSIVQSCPMLKDISVGLGEGSMTSYSFYILCNGCKHLTNVTINGLEDDTALEYIAQYAPQVSHLTLDYMTHLEDDECRLVRVAEHRNIEYLDLTNCNANSLLETIRLSPRLTYLSVNITRMTDETMTALADTCPLLTHLSTSSYEHSNNDYTDVGVCALAARCRQLKVLKLHGAQLITDTAILCIAQHCLDLTDIGILHNQLCSNNAVQIVFNSLKHLKLFSFFDNEHIKIDNILIRLTKDVAHLTLDDIKFCSAILEKNCYSSQHKKIGCCVDSRNNFSLTSIKVIAQQCAKTLQHISLSDFSELSDEHMFDIFSNCPLINSVSLISLPALTGRTIEIMTQYCPLLDSLRMLRTISLNDDELIALLTNKPHFKSLQLNGIYSQLTNTFVSHVATICLNIKTFEITGNKNITNSAVCDMIKHCSKLSLNQCTKITSRVLTAIVMHSHSLRSLDIEGCDKIKSREIVQFLQDYTELTEPLWHTL